MNYKEIVNLLEKDKIVFEFIGTMSQKVLVSTLSSLESKLEQLEVSNKQIQSLTIITIEIIQNIMNYSLDKSIAEDGKYTSPGLYILSYDDKSEKLSLVSSNKVDITKKDIISNKIDYINTLSKAEKRKRDQENKVLEKMITEIHLKSRGTYGSPRISRELQELGFLASKPRVARLMKSNGMIKLKSQDSKALIQL